MRIKDESVIIGGVIGRTTRLVKNKKDFLKQFKQNC